jgi:hypothetical protein
MFEEHFKSFGKPLGSKANNLRTPKFLKKNPSQIIFPCGEGMECKLNCNPINMSHQATKCLVYLNTGKILGRKLGTLGGGRGGGFE